MPVALFNVNGVYHAIHNTCPHEDGPLGEGELSHNIVTCPWHAYEFDVTSGQCLTEPAYSVERFEVRVEGDRILVSDETVQLDERCADDPDAASGQEHALGTIKTARFPSMDW